MKVNVDKQNFTIGLGILVALISILYIFHLDNSTIDFIYQRFSITTLQNFTIIFLSILFEALPFIILGAFISSFIQLFISEEMITKFFPTNKLVAMLMAAFMGLIFPICECAIIPIVRRLIKKGVPVYAGITFMMAAPIVNPIVLLSTYYAFGRGLEMVWLRGFLGLSGAMIIGYLISVYGNNTNPLKDTVHKSDCGCGCTHEHHHHHDHSHHHKKNIYTILKEILEHTSSELYEVGRFLIMGAFVSALLQTFVSRTAILSIGGGNIGSIIVMMLLAFILSLCSEADAFIAQTFQGQFTTGAIISFLIFGPMLDIKNTIMLTSTFKSKFVIKLILCITFVCFLLALYTNIFNF